MITRSTCPPTSGSRPPSPLPRDDATDPRPAVHGDQGLGRATRGTMPSKQSTKRARSSCITCAERGRKTYRIYWTLVPHPDPHLTHPIQNPDNTKRRFCAPFSRQIVCRDKGSMQGCVCDRDEVDRHKCLASSRHRHRDIKTLLKERVQRPETRSKRGRLADCVVCIQKVNN